MNEIEELSIFADDPKYDEDNPNEGYFSWYACDYCNDCLLYTSPSPRDAHESRMPSSA